MAIEIICAVCDAPIADGEGAVHIGLGDVYNRSNHPAAQMREGSERQPRWRAVHYDCHPGSSIGPYTCDVAALRTERDLIRWTAFLLEKNWLGLTDWGCVLAAYASGDQTIIRRMDESTAVLQPTS